ncbi:gamma-glutamylcyclotransferase family protein [Colwellia sp. C1TZA3]|uniref:gamma-glutamylcyclotransferase family protein n=1 Tax=Colwellia sp. C1TZA3 TaxID=2508879 RepID=UPI0011BA44FF|nr:gamma-glutamylcyclotransferase family protein [Colwellia sp. C1TZA3]TWX71370.1 gamma-glutamylcyclotransferase [Colwellia sp. C1TZA3]
MKYFAYGSNMSILRLQERVPSAKRLETVTLKNHRLRFDMSGSKDGSGKCDSFQTNNSEDTVIGALFEINRDEKIILDRAESLGYGYDEKIVAVQNNLGEVFNALIYCAINVDAALIPYSWYLNHVIIGAKESEIPADYLAVIESIVCLEDPDKARDAEQRAMYS